MIKILRRLILGGNGAHWCDHRGGSVCATCGVCHCQPG